jgi:hypothetical protein
MSARPAVSVVVVTYGHADEIGACLDGVAAQQADGADLEVVVVDSASTDATLEALAAHPLAVEVVARARNDGFSAAVNDGVARSRGELVLLLNPDCVMEPGCLAALAAHLEREPEAGGAAALLVGPDGELQRFARRDGGAGPALWTMTEVGRRLDERRGLRHRAWRRYEAEWAAGLTRPLAVDVPAAACVLVRRALLGPAPLDLSMPLFFSDAELFRRLRGAGWRFDVVPGARAFHGYGTSHRRLDQGRRRAEWVASLWRYADAWPLPQRALLALGLVADALAAGLLLALGRGRPDTPAFFRGTLGGLGLPGGAEPWLSAPRWRRPQAADGAGQPGR